MNTEIGTLSFKGRVETGERRDGGQWARQTICVENTSAAGFKHMIAFSVSGDKISFLADFNIGDQVKVDYFVDSREYNGKFYTDCRLAGIYPAVSPYAQPAAPQAPRSAQRPAASAAPAAPAAPQAPAAPRGPLFDANGNIPGDNAQADDDLPF